MTKDRHTPGWRWETAPEDDSGLFERLVDEDGKTILSSPCAHAIDVATAEHANILKAAPLMLEALEAVYAHMDEPGRSTFEIPNRDMYKVYAALSAARGEK